MAITVGPRERANRGAAVVVEDLVKSYGSRRAVDGLSFVIPNGEVFAILGPNGAGKTTTVEILEGYRTADSGRVSVLGLDPHTQGASLKPRIGVMLQESGLYPTMTPREALHLFAHYYRHPRDPEALLHLVGLEDEADTGFRRLSGGQKQRLSLALAVIGRPELVFLDEPTAGLDPHARHQTWDLIATLREQDVTVVLTTHYLDEAERLAGRIAIIKAGSLVALGTPAELVRGDRSTVRLRTERDVPLETLNSLPAVQKVRHTHDSYVLQTADPASLLVQVTTYLRDANIPVASLTVGRGLEEVYLELTGEEPDE